MSIHRRGDSYIVSYRQGGHQRSKFFGIRRHGSPEAALAAARDWEADRKLATVSLADGAVPTLRDLMVLYLRARTLHLATRQTIAFILRGPAADLADKPADQLTRADLEALRINSRDLGRSPNTINKYQAYLRAALAWGVEQGFLPINPWAGFKRLKTVRYQVTATLEDFRAILHHAPDWLAWALAVCYATACRWGHAELFSLPWTAFDWQRGTVAIIQGKTHRPKVVPVPRAFLAEAWRRYQADRAAGQVMVIHRDDGRPVKTYRKAWLSAVRKAGIAHHIRPYDLRHCVATAHLDRGTPLPVVAGLLGHATPQVTASVYAHAIDGRAKAAVENLPELA